MHCPCVQDASMLCPKTSKWLCPVSPNSGDIFISVDSLVCSIPLIGFHAMGFSSDSEFALSASYSYSWDIISHGASNNLESDSTFWATALNMISLWELQLRIHSGDSLEYDFKLHINYCWGCGCTLLDSLEYDFKQWTAARDLFHIVSYSLEYDFRFWATARNKITLQLGIWFQTESYSLGHDFALWATAWNASSQFVLQLGIWSHILSYSLKYDLTFWATVWNKISHSELLLGI